MCRDIKIKKPHKQYQDSHRLKQHKNKVDHEMVT